MEELGEVLIYSNTMLWALILSFWDGEFAIAQLTDIKEYKNAARCLENSYKRL